MASTKSDNCDKCFLSFPILLDEANWVCSAMFYLPSKSISTRWKRAKFSAAAERSERWKLKNKNSINIKYFPPRSAESLFVLCAPFIGIPKELPFFLRCASVAYNNKRQRQQLANKTTTKRWARKENKFHGIFLALLLRRNCFVYEFAIHKSFFLLLGVPFALLSVSLPPPLWYWKIMSFVLKIASAELWNLYWISHFSCSPQCLFLQQYSGTNAEFTKADTVIFRSDIYNLTSGRKEHNFKRTLKYDSKWLDSEYSFVLRSMWFFVAIQKDSSIQIQLNLIVNLWSFEIESFPHKDP